MANSDKDIKITPNTNQTGFQTIEFIGSSSAPIALSVLDDNSISFDGSEGQLFSINNNLTVGTIFSVNDVSGIPSIEVDADGTVSLAELGGNVGIGTSSPTHKLTVVGTAAITNISASTISSSLIPIADSVFDLGSPTNKWKDLYLTNASIYLGDKTISVVSGNLKIDSNYILTGSTQEIQATQLVNSLTAGSYLSGSSFDGSSAITWSVDATSANTASKVVVRDASGNFSAGTVTAGTFSGGGGSLTGLNATNISTGTLANARTTATSANTANAIVARDASGNFSAGTMTGNITGNAATVTNGVYTNTNQTITGQKTFSSGIIASAGVYLGGTSAVNQIDDYEEGSWTPQVVLSGQSPASYSHQTGYYTKIGDLVYIAWRVAFAPTLARNSGNPGYIAVTNLPFQIPSINPSLSQIIGPNMLTTVVAETSYIPCFTRASTGLPIIYQAWTQVGNASSQGNILNAAIWSASPASYAAYGTFVYKTI